MPKLRLLSLTALLLAGGCAYDSQAQGYDPAYPPPQGYGQSYDQAIPYGEADVPSVEVFFDQLAPYGRWVNSRYGRVWAPNVGRDWRPYTTGRWGEGRYWISDEPFGWAVYHYGRWAFDQQQGWLWVPGTEWAPSWVAWRDADDYAGWAPLPPGLSISVGLGFGYGYDSYNSWYEPSWVWVPRNYIYQPRFGGHILDYRLGGRVWDRSRWQPRPEWRGRPEGGRPVWNGQRPDGNRPGWNGRPDGQRPDGNRPGWTGRARRPATGRHPAGMERSARWRRPPGPAESASRLERPASRRQPAGLEWPAADRRDTAA